MPTICGTKFDTPNLQSKIESCESVFDKCDVALRLCSTLASLSVDQLYSDASWRYSDDGYFVFYGTVLTDVNGATCIDTTEFWLLLCYCCFFSDVYLLVCGDLFNHVSIPSPANSPISNYFYRYLLLSIAPPLVILIC
jgi:hypothetical protein